MPRLVVIRLWLGITFANSYTAVVAVDMKLFVEGKNTVAAVEGNIDTAVADVVDMRVFVAVEDTAAAAVEGSIGTAAAAAVVDMRVFVAVEDTAAAVEGSIGTAAAVVVDMRVFVAVEGNIDIVAAENIVVGFFHLIFDIFAGNSMAQFFQLDMFVDTVVGSFDHCLNYLPDFAADYHYLASFSVWICRCPFQIKPYIS